MLYNYKSGFNSLIRKRNEDHSPKTNKLFETKQQSLVNFLYKKYSIKYNLKSENKDLRSEIANYTKHMDSSSDLANLDKIIANMFAMPRSSSLKETGKKIISTYNDNEIDKIVERNNINLIEEKKELVINEDRINQSRESLMSGASQLSQFASSIGRKKDQENRRNQIKSLVIKVNNKEGEEKLKLEGNEWSLLAEYNRIQFIKDKENISKMKKKKQEILKKELDIQLKEKNLFRKKEKEEREMYGKMVIARVDDFKRQQKLDKIENFRKSVELKETRDKLLEDDRIRKKQDLINIRTKEQEVGIIFSY